MRKFVILLFYLMFADIVFAQADSRLLDSVIKARSFLANVIAQKQKYQPQIIFTQINRDVNNAPAFIDHTYLVDENKYFYCASLVKLPCSIFALEKINKLGIKGLDRKTAMLTDSAAYCQKRVWKDTTSESGFPTVEQHIKKMLLISDNNSYSRIYEFLNPKYISARLTQMGYPKGRIVHRFDVECVGTPNKFINPVRFMDVAGNIIYSQPSDTVKEPVSPAFERIVMGHDVYNKKKKVGSSTKDFTRSNYLSLQMIHTMLRNLVFNEYQPKNERYDLSHGDWEFLMRHLCMYPRESDHPKYNPRFFHDAYKKYFIYGNTVEKIGEDSLRIFNIVGRAYGYIVDCAYIVNYKTKTEFMISAVNYNNARNSFGTGNYEYTTVGLPFFKELSLALYALETNRKKKQLPNLDSVNFFKAQN